MLGRGLFNAANNCRKGSGSVLERQREASLNDFTMHRAASALLQHKALMGRRTGTDEEMRSVVMSRKASCCRSLTGK